MRSRQSFAFLVVVLLSSPYVLRAVPLPQRTKAATPPAAQAPSSTTPITTQTRVITIDVVVTDSHGNAVRDLKRDDFQIFDEHSGPQRIARFEFVDTTANAAKAAIGGVPNAAPYIFSNIRSVPMNLPPTVILLDSLNTEVFKQMQVRRDMLLFVKNLPPDTPVAVFLLGHTIRMVQNFTTNPALLIAAVNKSGNAGFTAVEPNPADDPNNASNTMRNFGTDAPEIVLQSLEDFEKEEYEMLMDQRVKETADAMKAIARFLGGYPGRKNLIWFSESFPMWIQPTTDFGSNPFMGSTTYSGKVREAAYALTDAQVAVYPVDARGLEGSEVYSAANSFNRQTLGGSGFAGALSREDNLRIQSQDTMDEVASETGGKTCKNTNDLAGCVKGALNESSSYYELAYYPENTRWDGQFHRITVKMAQRGVRLAYRRGYFATDAATLAQHDQPQKLLQQACIDALPATSIALAAEAIAPDKTPNHSDQARYVLTIPAAGVSLDPVDGSRSLNLQMAICEYTPKGDSFQFFSKDLSRKVPEPLYESWKAKGIRDLFDYDAKPADERLRFAVLDIPSGRTGALDVPAHPQRYGPLPAPVVPADSSSASGASSNTTPASGATQGATAPAREVVTSLSFKSTSGKSGKLDWKEGTLSYQGDLGVELGASAFFQKIYGGQFHCQSGSLVPNDPNSTAAPKLQLLLESSKGTAAIVDFTGSEPKYMGSLPVDPTAKDFFGQVWKLCHCQ